MFTQRSRRSGFTLPEVLVTVAIVAVLAAIVVPTVTSQIGKGDETNIATNVTSLRTGITAFVSDVRKFPSRIQHLLVAPAGTDSSLTGDYGAAFSDRWKGPYMSGSLEAFAENAAEDSVLWGLAYAVDALVDTAFPTGSGNVGVRLGGVTDNATALRIDELIDGGTGASAGSLRWALTTGNPTGGRLTLILMGR
jgi:prepilin-type N-terminal cleavage/methylation domain-containing protein